MGQGKGVGRRRKIMEASKKIFIREGVPKFALPDKGGGGDLEKA